MKKTIHKKEFKDVCKTFSLKKKEKEKVKPIIEIPCW